MKSIFIYISNLEECSLIYPLVSGNKEVSYCIYINKCNKDDFFRSSLGHLHNVQFVDKRSLDLLRLNHFSAFLSTNTTATKHNNELSALLYVFGTLQVPILDLQSSFDNQKVQAQSFATHRLTWSKNNEGKTTFPIGYPKMANKAHCSKGEYILVLSDFHKGNTSRKDMAAFYHAIYTYTRNHPTSLMIWKMSEEELANKDVKSLKLSYDVLIAKVPNSKFYYAHRNPILSRLLVSDMIAKSKQIITTGSREHLLDFEMYEKPVAFFCGENAAANECNETFSFFRDSEELEHCIFDTSCKIPRTGHLMGYDNDVYKSVLNEICHLSVATPLRALEAAINASLFLKATAEKTKRTAENDEISMGSKELFSECKKIIKDPNVNFKDAYKKIKKTRERMPHSLYMKLIGKLLYYRIFKRSKFK